MRNRIWHLEIGYTPVVKHGTAKSSYYVSIDDFPREHALAFVFSRIVNNVLLCWDDGCPKIALHQCADPVSQDYQPPNPVTYHDLPSVVA